MTNQLSPVGLAARRQALIQALASGQNNRPAFPGAGLGISGGNPMNNFASSFFSNGVPDANQFYGANGTGTVGDPMFSTHDANQAGQIAVGVGGGGGGLSGPVQGPPPPTAGFNPSTLTGGGIVGGNDPIKGVSPDWQSMITQLAGVRAMFNGGGY